MNKYYVWFDLLLNDYFSIENSDMTTALKEQLINEGVILNEIEAKSSIEAINKKYPKSNRQYLPNETNVSDPYPINSIQRVIH